MCNFDSYCISQMITSPVSLEVLPYLEVHYFKQVMRVAHDRTCFRKYSHAIPLDWAPNAYIPLHLDFFQSVRLSSSYANYFCFLPLSTQAFC